MTTEEFKKLSQEEMSKHLASLVNLSSKFEDARRLFYNMVKCKKGFAGRDKYKAVVDQFPVEYYQDMLKKIDEQWDALKKHKRELESIEHEKWVDSL